MKKVIKNLVIIIYAIIAIFVTICLLSYNDYKVTEFGKNSLVIVDSDSLAPEYKSGDLVIVNGSKKLGIEVGEKVFFYNMTGKETSVSIAKIIETEKVTEYETTYTLEGDKPISSEYVLGSTKDSSKISVLGLILGIFESKWGFLILIVLPALLALIYEIFEVVSEMKGNKSEGKNGKK